MQNSHTRFFLPPYLGALRCFRGRAAWLARTCSLLYILHENLDEQPSAHQAQDRRRFHEMPRVHCLQGHALRVARHQTVDRPCNTSRCEDETRGAPQGNTPGAMCVALVAWNETTRFKLSRGCKSRLYTVSCLLSYLDYLTDNVGTQLRAD